MQICVVFPFARQFVLWVLQQKVPAGYNEHTKGAVHRDNYMCMNMGYEIMHIQQVGMLLLTGNKLTVVHVIEK